MSPRQMTRAPRLRALFLGLLAVAFGLGLWLWRPSPPFSPSPSRKGPPAPRFEASPDQHPPIPGVQQGTAPRDEQDHPTGTGKRPYYSLSESHARDNIRQRSQQLDRQAPRMQPPPTPIDHPQPAAPVVAPKMEKASAVEMQVVAEDIKHEPIPGLSFSYGGFISLPTNRGGATQIALPAGSAPGQSIQVVLAVSRDWYLVNDQINVPDGAHHAVLVVMPRSTVLAVLAEARDATRFPPAYETDRQIERLLSLGRQDWLLVHPRFKPSDVTKNAPFVTMYPDGERQSGSELRKLPDTSAPQTASASEDARARLDAAARYGLTSEQLQAAIAWFSKTADRGDQGIALYVDGRYPQAEQALRDAVELPAVQAGQLLVYLGVAQFRQAKYREAVKTFQEALRRGGSESALLPWLGRAYFEMADWTSAATVLRRALASPRDKFEALSARDRLASLLGAATTLPAAELRLRQTLDRDERASGSRSLIVAADLNNLGVLLQATNRATEAEPLLRRAFEVSEQHNGPKGLDVAYRLNNLAMIFQSRGSLPEAALLLRRALSICVEHLHKSSYDDPCHQVSRENYRSLLLEMGEPREQIDAMIGALELHSR